MKQLKNTFLLFFVVLTVLILCTSSNNINALLKIGMYALHALALFLNLKLSSGRKYVAVMFTGLVTAVVSEAINAAVNGKNDRVDEVLINFAGTLFGIAAGTLTAFVTRKLHPNIIAPKKR